MTEEYIREHIDEFSPSDLAWHTKLSLDFYREFKDKINFHRLYGHMDKQFNIDFPFWYFGEDKDEEKERMRKIQQELLTYYWSKPDADY